MATPYKPGVEQTPAEKIEYLKFLEERVAWISWREPIRMNDMRNHKGLGCRICIAKFGIVGENIKFLPSSLEAHNQHLREYHHLVVA